MVLAPAVRSQPSRHLEDFWKRCLCLALGLQMVPLSSGLGTADLSEHPEPRSPCGESRLSSPLGSQRGHQDNPGFLYEAAAPHGLVRALAQCTVSLQDLKLNRGGRRGLEFGAWGPSGMHPGDPHLPCGQPQFDCQSPSPCACSDLLSALEPCLRAGG